MAQDTLEGKLTIHRTVILLFVIVLLANATKAGQNSCEEDYPIPWNMNGTGELQNKNTTLCKNLQCPDSDGSFCQCDGNCTEYGDCCRHGDDLSSPNLSRNGDLKRRGLKCVGTSFEYITDGPRWRTTTQFLLERGYYMVGECPEKVKNATLVQKCHDSKDVLRNRPDSWGQYADHVPVLDLATLKTFKNIHCAICNAVRYRNMRPWLLDIGECDVKVSPVECDDLVEFLAVYKHDVLDLRHCIVTEKPPCQATAMLTLCESYQAPYFLNGTIYKNPHCAFCNNERHFPENICHCLSVAVYFARYPQVIPFSFSDGDRDDDTLVFCADGLYYNQDSETCELRRNSTDITTLDHCLENAVSSTTNSLVTPLNETLFLLLSWLVAWNTTDEDFLLALEEDDRPSQSEEKPIDKMEITTVCTDMEASSSSSYSSLGTFNSSDVTLYTFQSTPYAIVRSKNRIYSDVKVTAMFRHLGTEGGVVLSYTTYNISIHIISREDLLCPYTVLSGNEHQLLDRNKSLSSKFLDYEVPLDDFLILSNGNSRICSHWIRDETSRDTDFLLFAYVILTIMSLIGLLLTFINYCLFKELRNLPGLITMNFIVALFFAQLILIPSYISPENSLLCTLISMAGHFLWLAVFLWMTIIAFDVTRTFGTSSTTGHIKSGGKRLAKYMLIGWLLPAVFVALCFVFRTWTTLKNRFTYGEMKNCWLAPGMANFLLFGVPASLCLCCNFIMFFMTVHGIWKDKKHTKMAKNMTTFNVVKEELLLSLKISILIGLSWIWAFLQSYFQEVVAFLFIHTFLNSLQGTFVFLIYVCNRRVIAMWKGKFKK